MVTEIADSVAGFARAWCLPEYGDEIRRPLTTLLCFNNISETTVNKIRPFPRLLALCATSIVCAVASSLAAVCAAADSNELPSVVVKFADLNLSNPEGVTVLYRRINAAARDVCKSYDIRSGSSVFPGSADPCVRKAIQDAVNKVGHPALLALYNARHPQQGPITVASAKTR